MKKRLGLSSIVAALLIASTNLYASQEGVLAFTNLHFESQGIGESGSIVVDAVQNNAGMQRFTVLAFGKTYELSESQLDALGSGQYNAIQSSYETGYKELGGRKIYIRIGMAFSSGAVRGKTVVVTEAGVNVKDRL